LGNILESDFLVVRVAASMLLGCLVMLASTCILW
jgi:hypothetical protein